MVQGIWASNGSRMAPRAPPRSRGPPGSRHFDSISRPWPGCLAGPSNRSAFLSKSQTMYDHYRLTIIHSILVNMLSIQLMPYVMTKWVVFELLRQELRCAANVVLPFKPACIEYMPCSVWLWPPGRRCNCCFMVQWFEDQRITVAVAKRAAH